MSGAPRIVAQTKVTPHYMLQQANCLGLHQLVDHVAEDGTDGIKPLVSVADVGETGLVEKDLLDNEDRDGL